mmetsp:Transcript_2564/g.10136  ORF Transcript_2564/g.10136 Transcript_2564/m.10136 type:complete len:276 (-) Transcript_2564:516-1343(-)
MKPFFSILVCGARRRRRRRRQHRRYFATLRLGCGGGFRGGFRRRCLGIAPPRLLLLRSLRARLGFLPGLLLALALRRDVGKHPVHRRAFALEPLVQLLHLPQLELDLAHLHLHDTHSELLDLVLVAVRQKLRVHGRRRHARRGGTHSLLASHGGRGAESGLAVRGLRAGGAVAVVRPESGIRRLSEVREGGFGRGRGDARPDARGEERDDGHHGVGRARERGLDDRRAVRVCCRNRFLSVPTAVEQSLHEGVLDGQTREPPDALLGVLRRHSRCH